MSNSSDPIQFSVPKRAPADKKKKLGKGLSALLSETQRAEPLVEDRASTPGARARSEWQGESANPNENGLAFIAVASIEPSPDQPRKHFDEAALEELAASIESRGVIQPVIVTPQAGGKYRLVAGERRWRAAQKARLHEIPAIVRTLDARQVMALALIENIQREDLNPVEEARAYHRLAEEEGLAQAEIARMVDKSRSHIANLQRLLQLPGDVLQMVEQNALSMGHARALIGCEAASTLAQRAVKEQLSVRDIEKLARKSKHSREPGKIPAPLNANAAKDPDIEAVQKMLEDFLGMKVRINPGADLTTGSLSINYRTLDQLDLLCQRLTGGEI